VHARSRILGGIIYVVGKQPRTFDGLPNRVQGVVLRAKLSLAVRAHCRPNLRGDICATKNGLARDLTVVKEQPKLKARGANGYFYASIARISEDNASFASMRAGEVMVAIDQQPTLVLLVVCVAGTQMRLQP
jgi:hypothetical protein